MHCVDIEYHMYVCVLVRARVRVYARVCVDIEYHMLQASTTK